MILRSAPRSRGCRGKDLRWAHPV